MMNIPPNPPKISTQEIFKGITALIPLMDCVLRWRIARIVAESIYDNSPNPHNLRPRLTSMSEAAKLLKEHGLPENTGNLKDHAFATALRAYNWLEQVRLGVRQRVDVSCREVQVFAGSFGFHYSEFRRLSATSYVCQGSVFTAMSGRMRDDFFNDFVNNRRVPERD